ncbi:MAG: M23 family metallopeptidase [Candidatus Rokubacteria bacterium]|nr:M23 family metallopeptidase [Candidatus Rokubacteria bacterium]
MRSGRPSWGPREVGAVVLGLTVACVAPGARAKEPTVSPPARSAERTHAVVSGDTLWALARRFGVRVDAIVTVNRLPSAHVVLRPGQRLIIPPATGTGRWRPTPAALRAAERTARRPAAARVPESLVLAVPDWTPDPPAFAWPVEGPVTSTFGRRPTGWHHGIDIKAAPGTPVLAAAAGVVVTSEVAPRYGRVVRVEHGDGFVSVYAHNDRNLVVPGDRVGAGETIATVGRTGRATTDHLHFEIWREGHAYNPLYLLPLPPGIAQVDLTNENPTDE